MAGKGLQQGAGLLLLPPDRLTTTCRARCARGCACDARGPTADGPTDRLKLKLKAQHEKNGLIRSAKGLVRRSDD